MTSLPGAKDRERERKLGTSRYAIRDHCSPTDVHARCYVRNRIDMSSRANNKLTSRNADLKKRFKIRHSQTFNVTISK